MSTPLDRLLAEELPTGTFGDAPPPSRTRRTRRRTATPPPVAEPAAQPARDFRWTPTPRADQDRHYAELAAAIGEPPLRAVPAPAPSATPAQPHVRDNSRRTA